MVFWDGVFVYKGAYTDWMDGWAGVGFLGFPE